MSSKQDLPGPEWLDAVTADVAREFSMPFEQARKLVHEAEDAAVQRGDVIEVNGVRWAACPEALELAQAEGDDLMVARLRRALREGRRG